MSARPPRLLVVSQPLAEGVPQHIIDFLDVVDPDAYAIEVVCPPRSTLWKYAQTRPDIDVRPFTAARSPHATDLVWLVRLLPRIGKADIIHAHSSKAGFLVRLAAAVLGRSRDCVFTPHAWSFWGAHGFRRLFYIAVERAAAHWCAVILVVSEAERRAAVAAGIGTQHQFRVVNNGVDLARFRGPRAPLPATVLVIGRLAPQKRPDLAVEVLERVRRAVPTLQARFVGDGPLRGEMAGLLDDRGLGHWITLSGDRPDVPELLRTATAVLITSDYEGCPLALLEAMAAGVPVVATAVGGIPEIVDQGRTGLLAPRGDVDGLATQLVSILSDPARGSEIGAAARREAAARFSRNRTAAEIVRVYLEILRNSPRVAAGDDVG